MVTSLNYTNVSIDGSFEDASVSWNKTSNATVVTGGKYPNSSGKELKVKSTVANTTDYETDSAYQSVGFTNGHKYYITAWAYRDASGATVQANLSVWDDYNGFTGSTHTSSTSFDRISLIYERDSLAGYTHKIYLSANGDSSGTYYAHFDGLMIIDLTATFGSGYEPTSAGDIDSYIDFWGGWWAQNTTKTLEKSDLVNMIINGGFEYSGLDSWEGGTTCLSRQALPATIGGVSIPAITGSYAGLLTTTSTTYEIGAPGSVSAIEIPTGHIVYGTLKGRCVRNGLCSQMKVWVPNGTSSSLVDLPSLGSASARCSAKATVTSNPTGPDALLFVDIVDVADPDTTYAIIDDAMLIDLTETFDSTTASSITINAVDDIVDALGSYWPGILVPPETLTVPGSTSTRSSTENCFFKIALEWDEVAGAEYIVEANDGSGWVEVFDGPMVDLGGVVPDASHGWGGNSGFEANTYYNFRIKAVSDEGGVSDYTNGSGSCLTGRNYPTVNNDGSRNRPLYINANAGDVELEFNTINITQNTGITSLGGIFECQCQRTTTPATEESWVDFGDVAVFTKNTNNPDITILSSDIGTSWIPSIQDGTQQYYRVKFGVYGKCYSGDYKTGGNDNYRDTYSGIFTTQYENFPPASEPPTDLAGTRSTYNNYPSVYLTWTKKPDNSGYLFDDGTYANSLITGYRIHRYSDSGGTSELDYLDVSGKDTVVKNYEPSGTNLSPGQICYFRISSVSPLGESITSSVITARAGGAPDPPTVVISDVEQYMSPPDVGFSVGCTTNEMNGCNLTGMRVKYAKSGQADIIKDFDIADVLNPNDGSDLVGTVISKESYAHSSFLKNTEYSIFVAVRGNLAAPNDYGAYSSPAISKTTMGAPDPPTITDITASYSGEEIDSIPTLIVNFEPPDETNGSTITGYEIVCSKDLVDHTEVDIDDSETHTGTITSWNGGDLGLYTAYTVLVRCKSDLGYSNYSTRSDPIYTKNVPTSPRNGFGLPGASGGKPKVFLVWSIPDDMRGSVSGIHPDGKKYYYIYRDDIGMISPALEEKNTASLIPEGWTDDGSQWGDLLENHTYIYHIGLMSNVGISELETIEVTTYGPPDAPVTTSGIRNGNYFNTPYIKLGWLPARSTSPVSGYNIYRSTNGVKPGTVTYTVSNGTSFNDTDILPNTTYYYWIVPYNGLGEYTE